MIMIIMMIYHSSYPIWPLSIAMFDYRRVEWECFQGFQPHLETNSGQNVTIQFNAQIINSKRGTISRFQNNNLPSSELT